MKFIEYVRRTKDTKFAFHRVFAKFALSDPNFPDITSSRQLHEYVLSRTKSTEMPDHAWQVWRGYEDMRARVAQLEEAERRYAEAMDWADRNDLARAIAAEVAAKRFGSAK